MTIGEPAARPLMGSGASAEFRQRPKGRPIAPITMSLLNRAAAAALAAGLAFGSCALAVVTTVGINDALALQACRDEARLARITTEHCYRR